MATQVTIKFNPAGFAECLSAGAGVVETEANKIASRANGYVRNGSGFHVEMSNEACFQDSARVVANDEATSAEEAENKILSKAVTG